VQIRTAFLVCLLFGPKLLTKRHQPYLVSNIVTIVTIGPQVELMILNEPRKFLSQEGFQSLFSLLGISPSHGHGGSFTQVMNIAMNTLDGHFLILIVTQEVEPLGQELIDNH
jgi:hypothetical protein